MRRVNAFERTRTKLIISFSPQDVCRFMHQLLRFWGSEATATRWTCGAWASSCTPCWSASRPSRPATSRPRACMMSSSAAILSDSPVPQVQAHQCQLVHTVKMFIPDAAKDLIRLILQPEPSQRPTLDLDQIAAHEYLRVPMDIPALCSPPLQCPPSA
jgi:hypothetical protein